MSAPDNAKGGNTSDLILDRMKRFHPRVIDLTLDRVWRLLAALGHPEQKVAPVIHIAGTNGKGSTLAMICAGLEAAGKTTNAYTSPHLVRFHERIRLNNQLITESSLNKLLDECVQANNNENITFFEITTCAALLAFSRNKADYTLLEVGLGGRLDATNVIDYPALSIITPISLDHQQYLGETIQEIATEKAGIIKHKTPVITGPQAPEVMAVIEARAERMSAPIHAYGQHWQVYQEAGRMIYQDERGLLDLPLPRLVGAHQIHNAGAAIAALRLLNIQEEACTAGLNNVSWPARMQRLHKGPLIDIAPRAEIWLDGGHNAAGAQAVANTLHEMDRRIKLSGNQRLDTYIICAMLNTKDVKSYMESLLKVAKKLYAITIPEEQNTLSAQQTCEAAKSVGMNADIADNAEQAVATIIKTSPDARILICGSLYLAGNILRKNA